MEGDLLTVFTWIKNYSEATASHHPLLEDIHLIRGHLQAFHITHTMHDANQPADWLASRHIKQNLTHCDELHPRLYLLVNADSFIFSLEFTSGLPSALPYKKRVSLFPISRSLRH